MPDSGIWVVAFVTMLAVLFIGRAFVAPLIFRRRREGAITGRKARWLFAALVGGPYVVFALIVAVTAPGALPIVMLVMVLTLPVFIIAWAALYRGGP